MTPSEFQLFVYGSLRSGFRSPAYEYITRYFTFLCDPTVKAKLRDMGEYAAGQPFEGEKYIIGELYRITTPSEFSWAMAQLDDYEGLNVEPGETQLFRRELVEVFCNDGSKTTAWIYWYNGDTAGRPDIESGDLMQYLAAKN